MAHRPQSTGDSAVVLRLEAELAWHEESLKVLPAVFASRAGACG